MNVQERFAQYLRKQALCAPGDRILLAVSGGKDSVLMTHLFVGAQYRVGIAHCNFRLRGDASDADEALVRELADNLDVPLYVTAFDTAAYAQQQGVSIQMAARALRYEWFETIRSTQSYDYVAVAQHQNDNTETVLLNLVRGTGLAGLGGIQPKREHVIRPLLFLTAEEVTTTVAHLRLPYRDDESNFSTKYARNKIRLEVVPRLKELNPNLERTFADNMRRLSASYEILQQYVEQLRGQLFERGETGELMISIDQLLHLPVWNLILYELFKPFHFSESVLQDVAGALRTSTPGKQFESHTHILHLDRGFLIIKERADKSRIEKEDGPVIIDSVGNAVSWGRYRFESTFSVDLSVDTSPYIAQLDAEKIIFPLTIRGWQTGDVFQPLGMDGKKKKVSDFFVSLKIPRYKKQSVPIVVNGNGDILWVVPFRMADHYKITGETKKVLTLACY